MITTARTYGVEIETGFPDRENLSMTLDECPREFSFHEDGSLRDCGVPYGQEFVSPILTGENGVRKIRRMCETLHENGADATHWACGMHVHIGANDLKPKSQLVRKSKLPSDVDPTKYIMVLQGMKISDGEFSHIISEVDYLRTTEHNNIIIQTIDGNAFYCDGQVYYVRSSVAKKLPEKELKAYLRAVQLGEGESIREFFELATSMPLEYVYAENDTSSLTKLKNIFAFYIRYNDVFRAMVANSRKDSNVYCQPIAKSFTVDEVMACGSYKDLQKLWYDTDNESDVRNMISDRWNDSRYHDFNLHSFFRSNGTIEIRSHGGTIDWRKIVLWARLHLHIIDSIAGESFDSTVFNRQVPSTTEELAREMCDSVGAPVVLRKYIARTIEHFSGGQMQIKLY